MRTEINGSAASMVPLPDRPFRVVGVVGGIVFALLTAPATLQADADLAGAPRTGSG
jgi:hypothetical protein